MGENFELERLYQTVLGELEEGLELGSLADLISQSSDLTGFDPSLIAEQEEESSDAPLYALLKEMTIPQKIKLAIFGNKAVRGLLIRETNKLIPLFVLQNSRLTDLEIAEFARNSNLNEVVFRAISLNQTWMKNYAVRVAIVANPKVPVALALKWIRYLQEKDLRRLSKSKDVPNVIATQCKKLLEKSG